MYLYRGRELTLVSKNASPNGQSEIGLFSEEAVNPIGVSSDRYQRCDAVTDWALALFLKAYPREAIGKEDIFFYVYGILHSADYRERYADSLSKEFAPDSLRAKCS